MTNTRSVAFGMWFVAGLFAGVAIYGAVKGRLNATFIAVAVVFFIVGVAVKGKSTEAAQRAPNEEL